MLCIVLKTYFHSEELNEKTLLVEIKSNIKYVLRLILANTDIIFSESSYFHSFCVSRAYKAPLSYAEFISWAAKLFTSGQDISKIANRGFYIDICLNSQSEDAINMSKAFILSQDEAVKSIFAENAWFALASTRKTEEINLAKQILFLTVKYFSVNNRYQTECKKKYSSIKDYNQLLDLLEAKEKFLGAEVVNSFRGRIPIEFLRNREYGSHVIDSVFNEDARDTRSLRLLGVFKDFCNSGNQEITVANERELEIFP